MRKYYTCILVMILLTSVPLAWAQSDKDKFIGTWRLIGEVDPLAKTDSPKPVQVGYIMYDSSGIMAVQIVRDPNRAKFASDDPNKATPEEIKVAYFSYVAYHGPYEVNEKEGYVLHHVVHDTFPNYSGQDRYRYYEFSGNRLMLYVTRMVQGKLVPKSPSLRYLIWERVR